MFSHYERFHRTIDALIEINRQHRELIAQDFHPGSLDSVAWAREFATIDLKVARRQGKTSYICNNAHQGDAVIVASENYHRDVLRGLNSKAVVLTPKTIDSDRARSMRFRQIFVDEPVMVFQRLTKAQLYSLAGEPDAEQIFVLLGTS